MFEWEEGISKIIHMWLPFEKFEWNKYTVKKDIKGSNKDKVYILGSTKEGG